MSPLYSLGCSGPRDNSSVMAPHVMQCPTPKRCGRHSLIEGRPQNLTSEIKGSVLRYGIRCPSRPSSKTPLSSGPARLQELAFVKVLYLRFRSFLGRGFNLSLLRSWLLLHFQRGRFFQQPALGLGPRTSGSCCKVHRDFDRSGALRVTS